MFDQDYSLLTDINRKKRLYLIELIHKLINQIMFETLSPGTRRLNIEDIPRRWNTTVPSESSIVFGDETR